jgi:hypothetical protein
MRPTPDRGVLDFSIAENLVASQGKENAILRS